MFIGIENLIKEFESLPKFLPEPTYLEICKYPRRRFEEICTRLLCFYLDPKSEHGFSDLFLSSLFELLTSDEIHFNREDVRIISEEDAEGKRLDILIHSSQFVIGIENKISASVYNPLETYKARIDLHGSANVFKVLLSLNKITNAEEIRVIKDNGFQQILYSDYFRIVKKKIGSYLNRGNNKYLIFLTDFIQTIENMDSIIEQNDKLSDFFFENSGRIDNMIELYHKYIDRNLDVQKSKIKELQEKLIELTKSNWWIWDGWVLGIDYKTTKPKIGIECYFEAKKGHPIGVLEVYISTWKFSDWAFYEKTILKEFPNCKFEREENKTYLFINSIEGDNDELILNKLSCYSDYLSNLSSDLR